MTYDVIQTQSQFEDKPAIYNVYLLYLKKCLNITEATGLKK